MKNCQLTRRIIPILFVLCLCILFASACQKQPVKINLISDKTSYGPEDPVKMQIRVFNDNINAFGEKKPVITRQGFFYQDFHWLLTIIDPKGMPVAKRYSESVIEPAPPYRMEGRFLVPVEIIPPDGDNVYVMNDARKYYYLGEAHGWYTAVVRAPFESFSDYTEGPTGELYGDLSGRCNKAYNPLSSNKIRFEIAPPEPPLKATLKVHVDLLTTTDISNPGGSKFALENAEVRLYPVSTIPGKYKPVGRKVYERIWNNVKPQQSGLTYSNGAVTFSGIEQGNYLILARHPVFSNVSLIGNLVKKEDSKWRTGKPLESYLSVIRKPDGAVVPGKTVQSRATDLTKLAKD